MIRITTALEYGQIDKRGLPVDVSTVAAVSPLSLPSGSFPTSASAASSIASCQATAKKQKVQDRVTNHISATRRPSQELLDEMTMGLVTFLVVNCLSINIVTSHFFQSWIAMMNPSYADYMPSPRTIFRTWIPRLRLSVEARVEKLWAVYKPIHPYRTLALDAVKTQGGDKVNIVRPNRCFRQVPRDDGLQSECQLLYQRHH